MVTVRITETYDMKTTVGKVGVVGIHTPAVTLLRKMYPGLLKNHKYIRFTKCDVVGACASVLPADPLQVGVEAGTVAPEDMFNPILYTAVSNSSFDTMMARIRKLSDVSTLNSVGAGDAFTASDDNNFKVYYALLAENGKYKKAMPQSGFKISGLVPLCHTIISPYGNVGSQNNTNALGEDGETPVPVPDMTVPVINDTMVASSEQTIFYRGKSVKMPKFPIHSQMEAQTDIPYPSVPETFVLAMILPPARLHEFYYRMRVTWTVRFESICSTLEATNWNNLLDVGGQSRGSNYTYSSSKSDMAENTDMVSAEDVSIEKIMES